MSGKEKEKKQMRSPCSCGGFVSWGKENVNVGKDIFRKLEVGTCDTCTAKYLSDDSADLILDKYKKRKLR